MNEIHIAEVFVDSDSAPLVVSVSEHFAVQSLQADNQVLNAEPAPSLVLTAGDQGPQGIQGVPGGTGGQIVQRVAGEPLSGHRIVYSSDLDGLTHCVSHEDDTIDEVLGVTTTAASAHGDLVNVQVAGELTDPSFNFIPGPVFAGADGVLTQTPPSTGATLQIGVATTPTTLLIRIQTPIH